VNVKLTNVQEAVLISLLLSYNQITKQHSSTTDKKLLSLVERILKLERKLKKKPLLTNKQDILLAEKYFNNLKKVDNEAFEEKGFSSIIMTIITLNYLIMHHGVLSLRVELGDIDTMKFVTMIDKSPLRATGFHHLEVFYRLLEAMGIVHLPTV
jgi:hypothetical protein